MKWILTVAAVLAFAALPLCAKSNVDETRALSENGSVYVDNVAGSVTVTGWDKNEVSVKGTYGSGVDRVDISGNSNTLNIRVKLRIGPFLNGHCDLEIMVPYKASIDINTVSARITVADAKGEAFVKSVSGEIRISGEFENLEVKSTSGDIEVKGSGKEFTVSCISGEIGVSGDFPDIRAKTVSGDITLEGETITNGDFDSTSGRISLACDPVAKAEVNAETTSGSIELITKKNLSAKIRLESFSGRLRIVGIDYNSEADEDDNLIEIGKLIRMTIGTGESKIELQSLSGSITLRGK